VIPRADNTGLRPVASVESTRAIAPIGDTRQDNNERLVRLEVGKQFQAQILSRFNDGTFLVRIADTAARIALPAGGKVGDGLALTLLTTDPRPTFSLDSHSGGAVVVTASGVGADSVGQTLRTAGAQLAQALYQTNASEQSGDTNAAPAVLSNTGRLITELLDTARANGANTALVGKTPLATTAGQTAPQLASALQNTLTQSGLFYESHVSQWANGQRPLADLLHEPQAQNSALATAESTPAPLADKLSPEVLANRKNLQEYFATGSLTNASSTLNASGTTNVATGIDPNAAQLINLQLNALEQQRVRWQGELWPGQPIEWEVSRQQQDSATSTQDGADTDRNHWQSVVRFSLPGLGMVSAVINLTGERVQVQVKTANSDTATALRQHGPELANALDAAGSTLEQLTIKHDVADNGTS
jgi:hypothetical protein